MDEGVVEGGIDVGNAEYQLSLRDLGTERDCGFLSDFLGFWWLQRISAECTVIGRRRPYHFLILTTEE